MSILHLAIDAEISHEMRERGGKWAIYRAAWLDTFDCGGFRFLQFDSANGTFDSPPREFMDAQLVGMVAVSTGQVEELSL